MNKILVLLIAAATLTGIAFFAGNPIVASSVYGVNDGLQEIGKVCIHKNDVLVECTHNLITNYGKELIKQATNGTASLYVNLTNLTLGGNTSAMQATDTNLENIYAAATGLGPVSAIYTVIGVGNSSLNYQWTATGASTYNVNSTGIYNTSNAGGKLFSEASFTNVQLSGSNGDKINVTYYWWVA